MEDLTNEEIEQAKRVAEHADQISRKIKERLKENAKSPLSRKIFKKDLKEKVREKETKRRSRKVIKRLLKEAKVLQQNKKRKDEDDKLTSAVKQVLLSLKINNHRDLQSWLLHYNYEMSVFYCIIQTHIPPKMWNEIQNVEAKIEDKIKSQLLSYSSAF
jgi:hypothetical protein